MDDQMKIQRMLNELTPRNNPNAPKIDKDARDLVIDYANNLSCSLVETAKVLVQHRNTYSTNNNNMIEISEADIMLVLGKKFDKQYS